MVEFAFFLLGAFLGGALGVGITNEVWFRAAQRSTKEMAEGWQQSIDEMAAAWRESVERLCPHTFGTRYTRVVLQCGDAEDVCEQCGTDVHICTARGESS